jgi:hypothetical protein
VARLLAGLPGDPGLAAEVSAAECLFRRLEPQAGCAGCALASACHRWVAYRRTRQVLDREVKDVVADLLAEAGAAADVERLARGLDAIEARRDPAEPLDEACRAG